jgi:hypothetical protein
VNELVSIQSDLHLARQAAIYKAMSKLPGWRPDLRTEKLARASASTL